LYDLSQSDTVLFRISKRRHQYYINAYARILHMVGSISAAGI
jgi:hypothetical protein